MKLVEQLRAEREAAAAKKKQVAESRRRVRRQAVKKWSRVFLKAGRRAAHEAARHGEEAARVPLIEEAIKPGAFWVNPGILVSDVEEGARQAAGILQRLGLRAEYVRYPVEEGVDEFQPTLILSGW